MSLELSVRPTGDGHTFWDSPVDSCQSAGVPGERQFYRLLPRLYGEMKVRLRVCIAMHQFWIAIFNFGKFWNQRTSFCATTFLPNSHVSSLP